jgi:hypothetical protein
MKLENIGRKKVKGIELVNILANMKEDYFQIEKEHNKKESLISANYYGKIRINTERNGIKLNLDLYVKMIHSEIEDSHGLKYHPRSKKKIKSIEGFIEYPILKLK